MCSTCVGIQILSEGVLFLWKKLPPFTLSNDLKKHGLTGLLGVVKWSGGGIKKAIICMVAIPQKNITPDTIDCNFGSIEEI